MPLRQIIDIRKKVFAEVKSFANAGSQLGDDRPISMVRFSPNSKYLATGSWSGGVKLWNIPSCSHVRTLRGHGDRVGGVAWHPKATITLGENLVNLVSGAADENVCLWSLNSDAPLAVLKGHEGRVGRVAFHPSGDYVASAGFDTSWRLWDVNTQKEILLQEGHSKEVFSVDFQNDGALLASGGLDAIGRVWDLRTGKTAMVLDGHVQGIYSISFSPNGYQIATGSGDDTIRMWDIRSLTAPATIPAHRSNVADVRFFHASDLPTTPLGDVEMADPAEASTDPVQSSNVETEHERKYRNGLYLASAGYDGFVKLWSADDWQPLRTLATDAGKVMSVDISPDGSFMASGTYNRNFQIYAPEGNA